MLTGMGFTLSPILFSMAASRQPAAGILPSVVTNATEDTVPRVKPNVFNETGGVFPEPPQLPGGKFPAVRAGGNDRVTVDPVWGGKF